jgi:uncharacterized protein (TIGR00369 family)
MTTQQVTPRSVLEQDRLESMLRALFEQRITFNGLLGLKVDSLAPESLRISFDMRPELVGHYQHGRLHGGVISATLDATAGLALMVAIARKHPGDSAEQVMARFARLGTIDLRVDFLRQGIGKRFHASATVTRLGGRVGSTQMRLENDEGDLIATGTAAYVLT